VGQDRFGSWAETTFHQVAPVAVISIELMGANHRGVMHSVTGRVGWAPSIDWHQLLQLCRSAGVLSIGIGDGGNEVGTGCIRETVRSIQDYGEQCQCPCDGGMATVEAADHLIVSGVSNWGGYALQAALGLCLGAPELPQSGEVAEEVIRACTSAGALESMYCTKDFSVDGVPGEVSVQLADILRTITRVALRPADIGPVH
jgi:D-glutamate cyclase